MPCGFLLLFNEPEHTYICLIKHMTLCLYKIGIHINISYCAPLNRNLKLTLHNFDFEIRQEKKTL